MALSDLSNRNCVLLAMEEYKELGPAAFLDRYGFQPSRKHRVVHEGRRYDSKPLLAAAHRFQFRKPLLPSDFSGGPQTLKKLAELGFEVETDGEPAGQNPDWIRDELILALDLYFRAGRRVPNKNAPDLLALSDLLRRLHDALGTRGNAKLRNPNGVGMKIGNLRAIDPDLEGSGRAGLRRGNRLEVEVWRDFGDDPARLRRIAREIEAQILAGAPSPPAGEDEDGDEEGQEGRLLTQAHRRRERDPRLAQKRKAQALKQHGRLECEACRFIFADWYGARGAAFIECHHTAPLSALGEAGGTTRLVDLALLCANCHRMVHAARPWLSVQELRDVIAAARGPKTTRR